MKRRKATSLLTDWLRELKVPCTESYCDRIYRAMPFHTLFGLKKALEDFGVACRAVRFDSKAKGIDVVPRPCVAVTDGSAVVLTDVDAERIGYVSHGTHHSKRRDEFLREWTGVAMVAYPDETSHEPSYSVHRAVEIASAAKIYVLALALSGLLAYFFITRRLYASWSTIALTLIDLAGVYVSTLLVRHQLGYRDRAAHRVCGVLQKGGCDKVLATSASKFFGLFGWSEVGLSYFGVTLGTMLLFPEHMGSLALINLCCLPFTLWSLWYQKFRARSWCTMCVSIQAMLWMQFVCYLGGGWYHYILPINPWIIALGAVYVAALLGLNSLTPLAQKKRKS